MDIYINNTQEALPIDQAQTIALVEAVLSNENQLCDEVGVNFVDQQEISRLHGQYFNDPTPTDCISFPVDDPQGQDDYRVLGDIFVCPEVAIAYAETHQTEPYQELTLYIVHALLHLMGYDDIDEKDRDRMRAAENRIMTFLIENQLCLQNR